MITINTHQAKTQLSALLQKIEDEGETVTICRNGKPVAQLSGIPKPTPMDRLKPNPALRPIILYDPLEPATEEEWPTEFR